MLDPMQMAVATQGTAEGLAQSALPDAPMIGQASTAWTRSRARMAAMLRRAADTVAPSDFAPVARPTLSTGGSAC